MQLTISTTNSFQALVPLSDYKGPILKLTKKDKEQIAEIQRQINQYTVDSYEHQRYRDLKKTWTEKDQFLYNIKGMSRSINIDLLLKKIEDIKLARLKKQQEAKNKKRV